MNMIKEFRIAQIGEVVGGGTPSTSNKDYWGGNIPWIAPSDLTGYSSVYISHGESNITETGLNKSGTKLLPSNTLLFSSRAPIGYIAIAANPLCTNQGFKSIICNEAVIDPLYLYYYIKANIDYFKLWGSGATFPEISGNAMKRIKIRIVEDLAKQKAIASILYDFDALIEVNNKRIKVLEQIAENLYKEWFVRFRFPGHETAEFENGIPKGWTLSRMEDFCYVTDGTHDTPKSTQRGVPLVTGKHIEDGEISFDEAYLISEADHVAIKRRSGLSTGDILFSNIGTVGKTCIVDYQREFSVKNVIIFKPDGFNKTLFLYYWLTSTSMQEIFSTQTNGASQQFVGLTFMRRYKMLVPSQAVLSQFEDQIYPIYQLQVMLRNNRKNLIKQRDLLLPRLMSGKLEVNVCH